jgi:hypothetical protein
MKVYQTILACLAGLLAVPLLAQPQIGGGTCSSSTLSGSYSATLTGRDLSSAVVFSNVAQSGGSVVFDGLSKVTFTLTTNSNKFFGVAQTLSGTYSLQSNCIGVLTITSGDTASFTLEAYNLGRDYLITGQDGVLAFTGSGGLLPTTCPTAIPTGTYSFNGTGFGLTSAAISGVFNVSGIIQVSGTNSITLLEYVTAGATSVNVSITGTLTVQPNCTATAAVLDPTGTSYTVTLELTSGTGENFAVISASTQSLFTGTGRPL